MSDMTARTDVPTAIKQPLELRPSETVLIVNSRSRHGAEWYDQARAGLKANGVDVKRALTFDKTEQLTAAIRQSLDEGVRHIVVGGGDGSLRAAAGLLAHTEATLGVLPLGTVNDFARNLHIEPTVEAACRVIADGYSELVDIGRANDNVYTITASLGFSARTQDVLSPKLKKALGPFGYITASILALRRLRNMRVVVRSERGEDRMTAVQAGVINGHIWMGGAVAIPGVSLENGRLAFYAVPPHDNLGYFRMLRALMRGRFFNNPGLVAFTTAEVTIETETPQPLVLDGDLCGKTPVRLRIDPAALRVSIPRPAPAD